MKYRIFAVLPATLIATQLFCSPAVAQSRTLPHSGKSDECSKENKAKKEAENKAIEEQLAEVERQRNELTAYFLNVQANPQTSKEQPIPPGYKEKQQQMRELNQKKTDLLRSRRGACVSF